METIDCHSTQHNADLGRSPGSQKPPRGCLKTLVKACLILLALILAILFAIKIRWDARFFDGYDPAIPLQSQILETGEQNGHLREKVSFQGKAGETVIGTIHLPKGTPGKIPCLVLLYGIGQKMTFVDEIAEPYVQAGYAILCIEQYGQGERKIEQKKSALRGLTRLTERLPRMVIETRRAVDYLETRPEIDKKRLTYFGISLGAIMGSTALAMEPRFSNGILMWGGGDLPQILTGNEFSRNELPGYQRYALKLAGSALYSVAEPLKRIHRISPRPLLFQNALEDEIIPKQCTEAYFNKARDPKEILWYECGHEKGLSMDLIHKIIADQISWLNRAGNQQK